VRVPTLRSRLVPILGLLLLVACLREQERTVPDELLGTWTTGVPGYADRHLRIGRDEIAFGTGDHAEVLNLLVGIDSRPADEGRTRYTLFYRSLEGVDAELTLTVAPGTPTRLQLDYREAVWTRNGGEEN
jgi:hypothetical protein